MPQLDLLTFMEPGSFVFYFFMFIYIFIFLKFFLLKYFNIFYIFEVTS